ncbi:DUF4834 family protein [Flavobacterium sp.]|uniref:DUF4834 family protein n=1 Tax=Flavobacterium sp. TaxID=239 RepID=UPI0037998467
MQTAGFSTLLDTLFVIITFYYIFKFLTRLFLPLLVKKVVKKAEESFQNQRNYSQDNSWNKTPNNDEIIYNASNTKNPRETKKVGDYVDYEEID